MNQLRLGIRNKLKSLQSLISNYDKERIDTPKDELINEMKDTKLSLDIFSLYEAQGAQTRARMKWIENGERNNKYFLGLEKSNYNKKNDIISQRWKWINMH